MIAVTGASGQLGRLVITALLQRTNAADIVALVRNPDKVSDLAAQGVQVRAFDYNAPDTLAPALSGVDKLLLISASDIGSRLPQHQAVIDAANASGVNLLAYTSILRADSSLLALAEEHKATEAAIQASGLPAVILRNGWYTENYTQSIGGVLQAGAVAGAAKDGRLHTAARADYAEAAAVVLTANDDHAGKVYELAGDAGFTLADYADEIARQSGKTIAYQAMSGEAFTAMLVSIGLPDAFAGLLADAEVNAADGWLAHDGNDLSTLIGRPTTPLSDSVTAALAGLA
ncbi:MAG TPA: NAD(P)-dependent oxidoreductase [Gammaproteobacteria bacterium]|jgi:NAD(P)H dehydrogenase (quinone)|nr:NAD(P)-dependent oxidoreductase [Gammaproteobacteria bacterium]